jgi:CO/xanthine dehydrogenase Mo-binding subunit
MIHIHTDGTASLTTGSVDLTGTRTSVAMQAAEVLGLSLEQIKSGVADTDSIGYSDVSGGSRTTMATGVAAIEAARDVIKQMSERAAILWSVPAETVSYSQGKFRTSQDNNKSLTFAELAALIPQTGSPITGRANVDVQEWGSAFGAHIVDVEVDLETGQVTILRYTVVQDVGKAIHPGQVEGQMQGAAVQGIGWALFEGYSYNEQGQLLNPNWLDYKLPTALDLPLIETVILEIPYPKHPYGARGVGETPIVAPVAAVANAIFKATGKRMTELPMTPARILEKMEVI